ncbi:hypothetical protein [Streptomyces xiamenensis]|uniref:hypothetical protein n=1 Tax=Streptomyces xiamenensis TaxID=408015 RepID=UPI0035DD4686
MNAIISATHVQAADATVTVLSNTPSITDWAARYFGPWWNAASIDADSVCSGPVVIADVDHAAYDTLAALVGDGRDQQQVRFAKAETLVARDGNDIIALSEGEGIAYRADQVTGRIVIAGTGAEPVALAAARLARESIRGQLLRAGWAVLHASAVVRDGSAVLAFGDKGAGKTTTAFLLAARGWELLANDRVIVRPSAAGVDVLPWPSAAALGLGLLDALGWYDIARNRLRSGESLHPTQHESVTEALLDGRREPLWEPGGKRERKVQVFPDQFPAWFGVPLATGGTAAALIFPQIRAGAAPGAADAARALGEDDFMAGATEDRYPDVFGLARGVDGGGAAAVRAEVARLLGDLPHHGVVLNHDPQASADVLDKLTDGL